MSSEDELRKQWLNRYLSVQGKADTRMRTVLIAAADDVSDRINSLASSSIFSNGVKSAQLKLVMSQVKEVLKDVFSESIPIISDGSKQSASAVVDAFSQADRAFVEAAIRDTGISYSSFIAGQKQSTAIGVANAVNRITKSELPLSGRVYRTQALAQRWVQNKVNLGLVRNASAAEIAKDVRASIRPGVSGGVSYAAMRLGRTEINNAFHATSISIAADRPWVTGMAWHLSTTHVESESHIREICEIYAAQSPFAVTHVPAKPHPLCRCYATPEVEEMSIFLSHLTSGQYKGWIQNAA